MTNTAREAELHGSIDYTRGRGFFDPAQDGIPPLTIVGAGGIGSPLALALAKMGYPHLTLIDGDTVEKHNLPNQLFPLDAIGKSKVEALADEIARYSPTAVTSHHGFVTDEAWPVDAVAGKAKGIVILALDNIDVRRMIWERYLRYNPNVPLVIDPRLGGQNIVVYTAKPSDFGSSQAYEATLHSSDESVEAPCTMRSIIDVGFYVASAVTRLVRRHVAGEQVEPTIWWKQDTATRVA